MISRLRWLAMGVGVVLLAGCAGYRLGPTDGSRAGDQSIEVHFFKNQTSEPRLVEPLAQSLRKTLQQDGTYKLDTRGGGDVVVNGTITQFIRAGISFQPTDVRTVRDYALSIAAHVVVVQKSSGRVLLEKEVSGRVTIRAGSDLASAERQAVPLLTEDLARNITALIVDGTW